MACDAADAIASKNKTMNFMGRSVQEKAPQIRENLQGFEGLAD
jgi:hypothetical protein